MRPPENNPEGDEFKAPARLVTALRQLPRPNVFVPPTVDDTVLRAARRQFEQRRARSFRFLPWLAAAAGIVLVIFIPRYFSKPGFGPGDVRFANEDLNHDGQVDILDAFTLARRLKAGAAANPQFDINHDGVVDQRDVATLAAHAVKLVKGGHS
jgi:Dockerin type I domain